mgnify:CR=1 FL=1
MKYNILKSEFESRNIFFSLIIIISFYQISVLNTEQLFNYIYPKLKNLTSGKAVNFCNNFQCLADDLFTYKYNLIYNDSKKKYFCMINNSLYLLINETYYQKIYSNYSINLDGINKYSINFYYNYEKNERMYIIIYILSDKIYLYEYLFNLSNYESYLINNFTINETNLSDDIDCLIENTNLKCAFYKKNNSLKLYSFKIEKRFTEYYTFYLDNSSYEDSGNIIKLSYNLNDKLFMGLFFKNLVTIIIYKFKYGPQNFTFSLPINKSELFLKNEADILWEESDNILLIFKENANQMKKIVLRQNYNNYEQIVSDYFDINSTSCSNYNNLYFLVNNRKYDLIQDCIDDNYCNKDNNFISNTAIYQSEEKKKVDENISEFEEGKMELNITKDELLYELSKILKDIDIEQNYKIKGEDFTLLIYPITNSSLLNSTTHVNFSQCEEILRSSKNLSSSDILTILQLEINNTNEKSLINKVEYQIYYNGNSSLDLSLCNDKNIKMYYAIKDNNLIDINSVAAFQELGIDIFNLNDTFFSDICHPYSDSNNDIVLEDRIKDIYLNYTLCEEGCTYNEFNVENTIISCDCKVKTNISTDELSLNLIQYDYLDINSNFGIIKCYNLVFSLKGKLGNIGFWIFLILVIIYTPLLIVYFIKGLNPLKKYIINEMAKNGYIQKFNNNKEKKKNSNKKHKQNKSNPPLKSIKIHKNKDNASPNNLFKNHIESKKKSGKMRNKIGNFKSSLSKDILFSNSNIKNINQLQTQGESKHNDEKGKADEFNLSLIKINLNKIKEYKPANSKFILNNYTYEEAIKYDLRSTCEIFYIFLLSKQAGFHAFLFRSPLEPFPLRLCLLIFIISSDLALNAFFYLDDKISEKYRYAKNIFLFAFNNNLTVILLSTLIGFVFLTLFTKLSNSTNSIRSVFMKEEEKLKKDKKYKVSEQRKKEILDEISKILKIYKIKVIALIVIESIFIIFFWYYVTAFCHVYSSTQTSWLWDSFLSILSRIIIDCLISLGFAKLYRIAIESNIYCLYKFVMIFYFFG